MGSSDLTEIGESFSEISPSQLVSIVAEASDNELEDFMSGPQRELALREIFARLADHVNPQRARGHDAVFHFKILDRPDGGYDHYEVILQDGACTVNESPREKPRVTIKIGPVHFLKLITNQASGPMLFMTRRLKLDGDIVFASQITSLFHLPSA